MLTTISDGKWSAFASVPCLIERELRMVWSYPCSIRSGFSSILNFEGDWIMNRKNMFIGGGSYLKLRRLNNVIATSLVASVSLLGSLGCRPSLLAGIFVNHVSAGEVDMIHLVESPIGHISGSLVISTLDANGSRKKDASYDVTGTVSGANVSLQLQGGLAGLAGFFGASTNMVGSLAGNNLTLSVGSNTEVFHEVDQVDYDGVLARLDKVGEQTKMVIHAGNAVKQAVSEGNALNTDLQKYIEWGQQRIEHVPMARKWYTDRIDRYSKCLQTIRPQAASKIPSWRWQDCVLGIHVDEYDRNQQVEAVRELQRLNQETVANLDSRIQILQQQFPKVVEEVRSVCPYTKDVDACQKEFKQLNALSPNGTLDSHLITTYRRLVPQANAAVTADAQESASGQSRLLAIQDQIDKVYRSAN
jgi:hypothetical protein